MYRIPHTVINMPDGSRLNASLQTLRGPNRRLFGLRAFNRGLAGLGATATMITTSKGICPVVNLAANACQYQSGGDVGCNALRECDPLTGATHGESPSAAVSGNVDMSLLTGPQSLATNMPLMGNAPGCSIPGVPCSAGGVVTPLWSTSVTGTPPAQSAAAYAPLPLTVIAQSNAPAPVIQTQLSGPVGSSNTVSPIVQPMSASPAVAAAPSWFTDPTQEIISGFPNWMLLAAAGVGAVMLFGGKH